MHARRLKRLTRILSGLTPFAVAAAAQAALVFQSETQNYAVSGDGGVTAAVKVYVAQTGDTTLLSDEGGLNSAGLRVVAVGSPANPPALQSVAKADAFTTSMTGDVPGGKSLYVEFADLSSGAPVDALGRVHVGTFTYAGYAGVDASTQFRIEDKAGDDTYTAAGANAIDSLIQPGTFTVAVPEPAAAMAFAGVVVAFLARRPLRAAGR